ncbi:MAG: thiamine diphosphokinase [Clostridia bacterium]|nr:thiamine diphosphokinase [Clostridia bacterium]
MSRCVIIAAGEIKDYAQTGALLREDDTIVCADGGVYHATRFGRRPDIVIGDFDSAGGAPQGVPVLRYGSEKDETDTMLCVQYALEKGFREFLILGGTGGRLDHTIANFSALLYIRRRGGRAVMAYGACEAHVIENESLMLKRRSGFYVSVFPFGGEARGVTETGLKYPLRDALLSAEFPLGVSNEFSAEEAVISVSQGALLIILEKSGTNP